MNTVFWRKLQLLRWSHPLPAPFQEFAFTFAQLGRKGSRKDCRQLRLDRQQAHP